MARGKYRDRIDKKSRVDFIKEIIPSINENHHVVILSRRSVDIPEDHLKLWGLKREMVYTSNHTFYNYLPDWDMLKEIRWIILELPDFNYENSEFFNGGPIRRENFNKLLDHLDYYAI